MKFIMFRDKTVSTLAGHSIEFKKGEPTYVVPQCRQAVMDAGAVPEDEAQLEEDQNKLPEVPQGAAREAAILDAIKSMVLRAERDDFTASGSPASPALSKIVGFHVDAKERDAAWLKAQAGDD